MDCWFSLFWWRWGELNPRDIAIKPLKTLDFMKLVSILVSIFRIERTNCIYLICYIRVRKVGVNLARDAVRFPPAEAHGNQHRHAQMVAQRREAMPQSVHANQRQTARLAYAVYLPVDRIRRECRYRPGIIRVQIHKLLQPRYHDRHGSP